ncbi:MAG: tetratricopeptide repeat protein [Corynebacterium sp.]|uniref:serine/threonine protein kinase n=1 Tax=Corynebacterium sp. TaxID=1720 RepID=UPI0026DB1539|nr:serine/threonine protein kinase [Corynebacterium sp.]MDO5029823.1 tetratricopeptide repeat protein [Corynebacterium sp.]
MSDNDKRELDPHEDYDTAEAAATQAVAFDPFADDEDDQETGTAAVAFDPFADDDDEEEIDISALLAGSGGAGTLGSSSSASHATPTQDNDPSMASHRKALEAFRRKRTNAHRGRTVADGMVNLPYITQNDPRDAVMSEEKIRATNKPAPSLKPGDIVADQYQIVGPIAHGGLGWIYLAIDHNVSDRWVVLKGMMAAKNDKDFAVVQAEREFLAEISHPGIVKIINFIDEPESNSATGFIVMEYVGGPSLRKQRRSYPDGVMPCDLAIGYILELLPALDYLHSRGVVYNDLKPDNVLLTEDHVTLIDVGAVTGIGAYGRIYGTPGFQAPEIATTGPTIASDIYTVGRTLASLILKLPSTDGVYDPGLPSPAQEPLFRRYYSLYRFLLRACHENPEARFASAEEMSVQLIGVLREILAVRDGVQFPHTVSNFSPQRSTYGTKHLVFRTDQLVDGITRGVEITPQEVTFALPVPLINPTDPGARILSASSFTEPNELIETLTNALAEPEYGSSVEIPLGIVRAQLDLGLIDEAHTSLSEAPDRLRRDWRYRWYEGITFLLLDQFHDALSSFHHVLTMLPGEPAPKLALAATLELIQQRLGIAHTSLLEPTVARAAANLSSALDTVAADTPEIFSATWVSDAPSPQTIRFNTLRLYAVVWAANPTTVSSAFGLARQLTSEQQHEMAIAQLDRVPGNSRHQRMARLTTILMLTSGNPSTLTESRIRRAARRLVELPTNEPRMPQLRVAVMAAALNWLRSSGLDHSASSNMLFDVPFTVAGLREGLEKDLRMLARSSQFPRHRYNLVDIANLIRPRTWR